MKLNKYNLCIALGLLLSINITAFAANAKTTENIKQEPSSKAVATEEVVKTKPTASEFKKRFDEARIISLAAGACAGTYIPGGKASEYSYLGEYGWEIHPYVVKNGDVESNFMIATNNIPLNNNEMLTVLAFRGSATETDWKLNLTVERVAYGGHTLKEFAKYADTDLPGSNIPRVHKGFNAYVMNAFKLEADVDGDNLSDNMVQLLRENPNFRILITGHSLGGAAATLFAERLVALGIPKEQVPVITFGAPAVGNKAFADTYGDKIDLLRVVTSYDPVPGSLQSIFGGFKQFGDKKEMALSGKYTDFQHPISFYFDLALKNFYDAYDEGIKDGYLAPIPNQQLKGKEPLVAIAVGESTNRPNVKFAPDMVRFVVNEYKSLFPRYIVLENKGDAIEDNYLSEYNMLDTAKKANADYIVILEVNRESMGQTNRWYVTLNQGLFKTSNRELLNMQSLGSRVTFEQGVMQGTIKNMMECQKGIREKLPWLPNKKSNLWLKNDILH